MTDSYSAWLEELERQAEIADMAADVDVTTMVTRGLQFALVAAVGNLYHVFSNVQAADDAADKFAVGVRRHAKHYREAMRIVQSLKLDG